jgi:DNA-binding beta-propeller fold protein YncE
MATPLLPAPQFGFEPMSFVNFETPHVHPLDITPNRQHLLAVNTAAGTLMIFSLSGEKPVLTAQVPVGLEPITVRAYNDDEAWVINHLSDTISVVSLSSARLLKTINTNDEPADVVFAGIPRRAFVSVSQVNRIQVFDPDNSGIALATLPISGEDPRALAVSPDGNTVYAAIFESGNGTTVLAGGKTLPRIHDVMSNISSPYAGNSVPPNQGASFVPAQNPANPAPPPVSLIVRKRNDARWYDDNNADWTDFVSGSHAPEADRVVGWDLVDRDLVAINANTLSVKYYSGAMNINMALAVNPITGDVSMVGTDATNEIRFEPNLNGRFLKVKMATFGNNGLNHEFDLNPHLDYTKIRIPQIERNKSIGDPRGLAIESAGQRTWITGMGSNNILVVNANGSPLSRINVAGGPTGIVIDDSRNRVYILSRFAGAIVSLSLSGRSVLNTTPFFDPTPAHIKGGRPFLYNTHISSGLGQASCASCHVDGRTDRLVWDLGNPAGAVVSRTDVKGKVWEFHPMKGPMKTQTLVDIIGSPSLHHRGDRNSLADFAAAFPNLQGADEPLDSVSIKKFETFLDSIHFGPNPNRNKDNTFSTSVNFQGPHSGIQLTGNAVAGMFQMTQPGFRCLGCHVGQRGRSDTRPSNGLHAEQPAIAEPLGGFYDRMGFFWDSANGSTSGFGFRTDGSQDSTLDSKGSVSTNLNNINAVFLSWEGTKPGIGGISRDAHAGVGWQMMTTASAPKKTQLNEMVRIADSGNIGLIAHGIVNGSHRGFFYTGGGWFQSDVMGDTRSLSTLNNGLGTGDYLVYMLVPRGSEYRIGVDADLDGLLDGQDDNPNSAASTTWSACANELERCNFTGTAVVRYGANGKYLYTVASNGIECRNFTFGDPIGGIVKHCDIASLDLRLPVVRDGVLICAQENQTCLVPGRNATVRYGAPGHWVYLTGLNATSIPCNNKTFGDPITGIIKRCEIINASLLPRTATSDVEWIDCSEEGGVCALPPGNNVSVRYGANGQYKTGKFKFSVSCSNSIFGEPILGVQKKCQFPRRQ